MQFRQKSPVLWVTSMFLCIVVCFDLIGLFTPDKEFSETENRMLAKFPEFSSKSVCEGTAGEDAEKYLSDQFAFRDAWSAISFFTKSKLLGQKEINGVYIGKDGYLMMIPSDPEPEAMKAKLSAINAVTDKYSDLHHCIAVIPNAATVMTNKMPSYVPDSKQPGQLSDISAMLNGITFCDVTKSFKKHRYEELYYHTDHHWTSRGAYLAFTDIAPDMQIDPDEYQYDIYTVSDSFQGTLASKSGSYAYNDRIEIYVPQGEHPVSVRYSDEDDANGSIYQKKYLDTKDKYALFLGGNHPVVTITTTADADRTLMLIKDSYANCFVQFLIPYFDQIIIVDPRYCYDSVDMLINQYEITDLLYLYNADTFMTDTSLTDFLTFESSQDDETFESSQDDETIESSQDDETIESSQDNQ